MDVSCIQILSYPACIQSLRGLEKGLTYAMCSSSQLSHNCSSLMFANLIVLPFVDQLVNLLGNVLEQCICIVFGKSTRPK
jgi:hypothetical protein